VIDKNETNAITSEKINGIRLSISDLRDHLYISNLKKDLKEFVFKNVNLDDDQSFLKTEIITDVPSWFPKAELSRTQTDLIATSKNGEKFTLVDFFTHHEIPSILTENDLMFNGALVNTLAGPAAKGQYAQALESSSLSIGEVSSLTGNAQATRLDGNKFNLSNGDPVFQGDTIEVLDSGAVGLTFLDKTTLSLSENGKMVLDELIFDPTTGNGSMAVDMVEGAFSFISGEIAKTGKDAMTITTPVATIGIRGTTVAGKAAVEGNENSFTLLQDADGGVGQISISNAGGIQILEQVGATTSIASFNVPPPPPVILSAAQIQANYGTALNVLPPTPTVPPTPQQAPPPQEQQQEEAQAEASEEESDEEAEEASQEVPEEEGSLEEEELAEGEEEIAIAEEGLSEEDVPEDRVPAGEDVAAVENEDPPPDEAQPEGDEQAAREAFDTALATGASPEQAMAEAAAIAGFNEPVARGSALDSGQLGESGPPLVNDPLGGAPFAQTFAPGVGGPILGSPLGPAPMNFGKDSVIIPVFGMGPAFGPATMDTFGGQSSGRFENFLQGTSGFGDEIFGVLNANPYSLSETESFESYFFDDPSLYDDYKKQDLDQSREISSSQTTNTFDGTNSDDTIDKSSETSSVIINGLDGADTLEGGINNDTINGGDGVDKLVGNQGDDVLRGDNGNDFIFGGDGQDKLIGGLGDDEINGGDQDDIIVGGLGSDTLYGNDGNDKFYFEPSHIDGTSKDEIVDFRLSGNDLLVSSQAPSSAYNRSSIYTDSSQFGSNYDITSNSNELPYVFNFTNDVTTAIAESSSALANHFTGFSISVSGSGTNDFSNESMFLTVGDGASTYIWFWTDTNNHHGMIADNELEPLAKLSSYNNDNLTGNEFVFETISGV